MATGKKTPKNKIKPFDAESIELFQRMLIQKFQNFKHTNQSTDQQSTSTISANIQPIKTVVFMDYDLSFKTILRIQELLSACLDWDKTKIIIINDIIRGMYGLKRFDGFTPYILPAIHNEDGTIEGEGEVNEEIIADILKSTSPDLALFFTNRKVAISPLICYQVKANQLIQLEYSQVEKESASEAITVEDESVIELVFE